MSTKTFTKSHYTRLINPLTQNPDFDLYLKSLKSCLHNQIDISPLQQWWSANSHLVKSKNALIDFAALLEEIKIKGDFKGQASAAPVSRVPSTATRKKGYNNLKDIFPWTDMVFESEKLEHNSTRQILNEYSTYLSRYHLSIDRLLYRLPRYSFSMVVTSGTVEHDHLVEISHWVAKKSGIRHCHYVFETILKARGELVLYSDDVFKAATKCPHRLFILFMKSDFSGFNFENGKALVSLLSLPVGSASATSQQAYLSPDYPFFGNDLFKDIQFNVDSGTLVDLKTAWANFYQQWDSLPRENNEACNSGDLFAITVASLTGCTTTVPTTDLKDILETIKPNIWCVQFWLHQIVLVEGSPALSTAIIKYTSGQGAYPDFVQYFFVVADYVQKQGRSDLSSCILTVGILLLVYWADENPQIIDDCLSNHFTVLFNHRRMTNFRRLTGILIRMYVLDFNQIRQGHLGYLLDVITIGTFFEIDTVGQGIQKITQNIPFTTKIIIKSTITQIATNPNRFDEVVKLMAAAMNSNGGDILIPMSPVTDESLKIEFTKLQQMIVQLEESAERQGVDCIDVRLDKSSSELWIRLYRSSRPVFINKEGFSGLWVFLNHPNRAEAFYGAEASKLLTERFTLLDKRQSIVLSCDNV